MTKMNWDRVNMENLAARRLAEHLRGPGDSPKSKRSPVRKSSYFKKTKSKTLKTEPRSLVKVPTVVSLEFKRCEHCGVPVKTKNIKKHVGRVHSLFNRVIRVLSLRKQPKNSDAHECVEMGERSGPVKTTISTEAILEQTLPAVDLLAVKSNAIPKPSKKKKKAKKQKDGLLIDVLYSQNKHQLAQTISNRLNKLDLNVRLIQTARNRGPKGTQFGNMTCYSKTPETLDLANRLVEELSGTIDLIPKYENLRRNGGVACAIWVCEK